MDGSPTIYYKICNVVVEDITILVLYILNDEGDPSMINKILIMLIPKHKNQQMQVNTCLFVFATWFSKLLQKPFWVSCVFVFALIHVDDLKPSEVIFKIKL